MPNQSADYFDDKYEASYEQYSQVLDKYTGRGEEKKSGIKSVTWKKWVWKKHN